MSQVAAWLRRLKEKPSGIGHDEWVEIVRYLERHAADPESQPLLEAIDLEQLDALAATSRTLFAKVAAMISEWAERRAFDFNFCDVLGARLDRIYELGGVREKAAATLAALELACSHNRWHVMRLFMRMAGTSIDDDLADRLAVEMFALDAEAVRKFRQLEWAISASRGSLHPKVRAALDEIQSRSKVPAPPRADFIELWGLPASGTDRLGTSRR